MSEWNKLFKVINFKDFSFGVSNQWLRKVKAVGDKNQEKLEAIRKILAIIETEDHCKKCKFRDTCKVCPYCSIVGLKLKEQRRILDAAC